MQNSKLTLIAHRGASSYFPENTLLSFTQAIKTYRMDMVELDVRETRDGIPVAIHDATVDRTTNGSGLIRKQTWNTLKKLDAGFQFNTVNKRSLEALHLLLELIKLVTHPAMNIKHLLVLCVQF